MRRKWVVVAVVVVAGAAAWWYGRGRERAPSITSTEVVVTRGTLRRTILATGVVEPQNRVEIKPPIAGRIEDVLVREGASVRKGEILAWMSSSERAALLDAARAKGEAELAHWEEHYRAAPLLAPLDGTIIAREVEPGQTVTAADAVLVLADRLIVKAQVDETDIGQIQLGQRADIEADAYPGRDVPGRVDHIAYEATTVNNVTIYEVDVLPDSVPDFLRSGMTANVGFIAALREGVLVVPSEAVTRENGQATVLRRAAGAESRETQRVPVECGLDDGKQVEILSGLSEGDVVLVRAFQLPQAAAKLTNPFAPMPPGRGGPGRR